MMTPPKHVLDPTHDTVLFEGPLGFGSVEEKIPNPGREKLCRKL